MKVFIVVDMLCFAFILKNTYIFPYICMFISVIVYICKNTFMLMCACI